MPGNPNPGGGHNVFPSGNFLLSGAQAVTEDLSWFKGAIIGCGEASALVIAHLLKGQKIDPQEVTNLIQSAANAGQLSGAGGGQTPGNIQWDLSHYGIQSTIHGWTGDTTQMANLIDASLKAGTPVELGVSNGNMLTGEPSGLRGHYITIVGEAAGKFLVADPNTAESKSGKFVSDSWQQILDANPFAVIVPSGTGPVDRSSADPGNQFPGLDLTGWAQAIAEGLATGMTSGIANTFIQPFQKATGIVSLQDLGWRSVLVFVAIILLVIGFIAIVGDFVQKNPEVLAAA